MDAVRIHRFFGALYMTMPKMARRYDGLIAAALSFRKINYSHIQTLCKGLRSIKKTSLRIDVMHAHIKQATQQ
jgi:hypothetical protein